MFKKPNPCPSEWERIIKIIFRKASSEAYMEYKKDIEKLHKPKPTRPDFKKKTMILASKYASSEEQRITKQHREVEGKEFLHCFKLVEGHLERGENEEDLEKIIQECYDRLNKGFY